MSSPDFVMFQPPVDYSGLTETGRRKITQPGHWLCHLCYSDGCLYTLQQPVLPDRHNVILAVYHVGRDRADITLLDTLELGLLGLPLAMCHSRVERHSQRVFIPRRKRGVTVVQFSDDKLVTERTLTCVKGADGVDVMSPDTIYVGSDGVYVVDVKNDRITSTLELPTKGMGKLFRLAVLGDIVMVADNNATAVLYHHGSPVPVKVITFPSGVMRYLPAISTDFHHHFLVTDHGTNCVLVLDVNGQLRHTLKTVKTDPRIQECAVVNRQVWVGFDTGDILILSSHSQL